MHAQLKCSLCVKPAQSVQYYILVLHMIAAGVQLHVHRCNAYLEDVLYKAARGAKRRVGERWYILYYIMVQADQ